MSARRCEMVIGYKLAADGESPGDEIYCAEPATAIDENGALCCDTCAQAMVAEGFAVRDITPEGAGGLGEPDPYAEIGGEG